MAHGVMSFLVVTSKRPSLPGSAPRHGVKKTADFPYNPPPLALQFRPVPADCPRGSCVRAPSSGSAEPNAAADENRIPHGIQALSRLRRKPSKAGERMVRRISANRPFLAI